MTILVIITIILILTIPLSFVLYSLNQTVLKPYSWNEYIIKSEIAGQLPDDFRDQFANVSHPLKDEYEELFISTLEEALEGVVTQEWMDDKINELQMNIWDYLLEVTKTIEPIHMDELKEAIIFEFELVLDELGLPEENISRFISEIENQMPAELHIDDVHPAAGAQSVKVQKAYQQSQLGYDAMVLLTIILFVFGLILTFSPKSLFRWSGYVLSTIGLLVFLAISFVKSRDLELRFGVSADMNQMENAFTTLFVSVLTEITQIIYPLAIGLLSVGLLLVLFSHFPFIQRVDPKLRGFFANHPAWGWVRAVIALFFLTAAVYQVYQLTSHTNAIWQ